MSVVYEISQVEGVSIHRPDGKLPRAGHWWVRKPSGEEGICDGYEVARLFLPDTSWDITYKARKEDIVE